MKSRTRTRSYSQVARAEAAEATGRRIVDAFLARLMTQWYDEITLDSVAAEAEVTVQTVVRRFGGKEGLLAAAMPVFGAQVSERRETPTGDVDRAIDKLFEDYARAGDAVIRLLSLEGRHAALSEALKYGRGEHRKWVAQVFAQELAKLENAARERLLDTLVICMDVYTWKLLYRDMGRSEKAAKAVMKGMIRAAVAESAGSK